MADETPTEVEAFTKAKWSGAVSGFLSGIVSNWREIALIASLAIGLWGKISEKNDVKWVGQHLQEKQQQIDEIKTNIIETP